MSINVVENLLSHVSAKGAVYTWGRGDYGQLGRPLQTQSDYIPRCIDIPRPLQVSVGSEHNMLLSGESSCMVVGFILFGSNLL